MIYHPAYLAGDTAGPPTPPDYTWMIIAFVVLIIIIASTL